MKHSKIPQYIFTSDAAYNLMSHVGIYVSNSRKPVFENTDRRSYKNNLVYISLGGFSSVLIIPKWHFGIDFYSDHLTLGHSTMIFLNMEPLEYGSYSKLQIKIYEHWNHG